MNTDVCGTHMNSSSKSTTIYKFHYIIYSMYVRRKKLNCKFEKDMKLLLRLYLNMFEEKTMYFENESFITEHKNYC